MPTLRKNLLLELKEMVDIVNRYKRKDLKVLGYSPDDQGLHENFYNALVDRMIKTDAEAAKYLLGVDSKDKGYNKLKNEFFRRIINTAFFIDLKDAEFNDAQKAFYNGWKYLAAAKTVGGRGGYNAAVEIAKRGLKQAQKYDLTELIIEFARILKEYIVYMEGDKKQWEKYRDLIKNQLEIQKLEIQASDYHEEMTLPFQKTRTPKPEVHEIGKKFLTVLNENFRKGLSQRFYFFYFLIKVNIPFSIYDYKETEIAAEEAVNFFMNYKFHHNHTISSFMHILIICKTMMGKIIEAEKYANKMQKFVVEGTPHWYKGMLQVLTLQFHKGDFESAFEVFMKARKHAGFEKLSPLNQELWKIQEGYIQLLALTKRVNIDREDNQISGFKIAKFLNEFSAAAKDKRGLNVHLQILHTLFFLIGKDFEKTDDRIKALGKYVNRHLNPEDEGYRTSVFVQMLQKMAAHNFIIQNFEIETTQLKKDLGLAPPMLLNQAHEIEYLRFEQLWDLAMQALNHVEVAQPEENAFA